MRRNTRETVRIEARTVFGEHVVYRRWNTRHGGVYVPVSDETQPNPYLSHIPERDVATSAGKRLTLMNPAYMTRQVFELAEQEFGILEHITSLKPIRAANAPDPWETGALRAFERGDTEVSAVEKMESGEYMRLMRPLVTEQDCLQCHAAQGYREGDIRGGISVAIPMEQLRAVARGHMFGLALSHGLVWLAGLVAIGLCGRRLRHGTASREALEKEIAERRDAEERLRRKNRALGVLSRSTKALVQAAEESQLFTEVCRIAVQAGGYRMAWVGYPEQDEAKSVRPIAQAGFEKGYLDSVNITWADTERGRGPTGTAIRTGKPCIARNIPGDPDYAPWRAAAIQRGYASSAALPLVAEEQTLGALNIYASQPDAFDTEEAELLTELTQTLAYGIVSLRARAERTQAEAALQESETKFKTIFDSASDGMFLLDLATKKFVICNKACSKMVGFAPEEFVTLDIADLHPPEDLPFILEQIGKFLKGEEGVRSDVRFKRKDGSLFFADLSPALMTIADRRGRSGRLSARAVKEGTFGVLYYLGQGARGVAASGRGQGYERDRLLASPQRENRREAPAEHHGQTRHPQRCRADQVRHPPGSDFAGPRLRRHHFKAR